MSSHDILNLSKAVESLANARANGLKELVSEGQGKLYSDPVMDRITKVLEQLDEALKGENNGKVE